MQEHRHVMPDGVALQVVTAGRAGPTLLVLPGFGSGIDSYRPLLAALARDHRVVGLSPRGFGTSDWASPYTISDWVADAVGVTADAADGPVVAVGHSFGAWLALAAAARAEDQFRAVVSLDQILDLDAYIEVVGSLLDYWQDLRRLVVAAEGDANALANALADQAGDGQRTATVELLARRWAVQDPRVLDPLTAGQFVAWLADPSILDLPKRYDGPLLCVDGDIHAGSMVSDASAAKVQRLFANSVQRRLAGVGHDLGLDHSPHRVADLLGPFVAEHT